MSSNKAAMEIPGERPWIGRLVGVISALLIGSHLGPMTARGNADAASVACIKGSGRLVMNEKNSTPIKHSVQTPSGRISYTEQGTGPVALFVHGVLLNGYLWRHQLTDLSDIRRCIAVDLLAHGDTEITSDEDLSVTANAKMLKEFLDALNIDKVDLVGNDSGGGIAQIFAALYPERVRTLALTDCDTHEYPEQLSDDTIESYLRPLVRTEQRTRDLQRFLAAFDNKHTLAIEARLRTLKAPTLIVWGTDDAYFDVKWSHWLAENIPGTKRRVEFKGARIFFPEERWQEFDKELRAHWQGALQAAQ